MRFRTNVSLLLLALFIGAGVFSMNVAPVEAVADEYSQDPNATEAVKKPVASDKLSNLQQYIKQIKAQIAGLQKKLRLAQGVGVESPKWCHNFKQDLRYGDKGQEVRALQIALKKQGFPETLKDAGKGFRNFTAASVVGFQEKYRKQILKPLGLKHGTGFVGKLTRVKLNRLYGCGLVPVPPVEKCTDTDGGKNYYKKGATCRNTDTISSTGVAGMCKTDRCTQCLGLKSPEGDDGKVYCGAVEEYYCQGNMIKSETYVCPEGCKDGACVKGSQPYCGAVGSRSEGWYQNGKLIRWDSCEGCFAVCKAIGTKSEGWYSSCDGELIQYDNCGEEPAQCTSGEEKKYICSDGTQVPWCTCNDNGKWVCIISPESQCESQPEKSITMISPNGGEKGQVGRTYKIRWKLKKSGVWIQQMGQDDAGNTSDTEDSTAIAALDKVDIYLVDDSSADGSACTDNGACCYTCTNWKLIASDISAYPGIYEWTIDDDQKIGDKYKIFIRTKSNNCFSGCVSDYSDDYSSIVEKIESACSDTDGGKNYFVKGSTCKTVSSGKTFCRSDICLSDMPVKEISALRRVNKRIKGFLKEYYCRGDKMLSRVVYCKNGCADGACLKNNEELTCNAKCIAKGYNSGICRTWAVVPSAKWGCGEGETDIGRTSDCFVPVGLVGTSETCCCAPLSDESEQGDLDESEQGDSTDEGEGAESDDSTGDGAENGDSAENNDSNDSTDSIE